MKRNSARRWLILPLGLLLATAAGYALLMGRAPGESPKSPDSRARVADVTSPHPVIREDSRARLREILREADTEPRR